MCDMAIKQIHQFYTDSYSVELSSNVVHLASNLLVDKRLVEKHNGGDTANLVCAFN